MKSPKGIQLNDKLITIDNITIEDIELLFEFDKNVMLEYRLSLGKKYIENQFPENKKQTDRVKKILARNIELTDPKTFKDVKKPVTYNKLLSVGYVSNNGVPKKKPKLKNKNEKTVKRFFKKPRVKTKSEIIDEKIDRLENEMRKIFEGD